MYERFAGYPDMQEDADVVVRVEVIKTTTGDFYEFTDAKGNQTTMENDVVVTKVLMSIKGPFAVGDTINIAIMEHALSDDLSGQYDAYLDKAPALEKGWKLLNEGPQPLYVPLRPEGLVHVVTQTMPLDKGRPAPALVVDTSPIALPTRE